MTLTGAGGVGKTRLAVQVAAQMAAGFGDGVWYVDLAPITDPDRGAGRGGPRAGPARSAGPLHDGHAHPFHRRPSHAGGAGQLRAPARRHARRWSLPCLGACPGLTLLATSREPIGVPGEVTWRVPSLSLADEAIELFTDRARRARPDFSITDDNAAAVSGDLPPPRRHAAGDRAGGGAGARVVAGRDPRQPA